jgi:hypothetical protein
VLEGDPQSDLDEILSRWLVLATVGFQGQMMGGRGAVVMRMDATGTEIEYTAGPPCPCHSELVET